MIRPWALPGLLALVAPWVAPCGAQAQRGESEALCSISSTSLNFGRYDGTNPAPADFTATLSVTCTPAGTATSASVSFTIALVGGAGGPGQRHMNAARDAIRYELYTDPGRSIVFGDGAGGSAMLAGAGVATRTAPLRQSFTVYGRVLARQRSAPAGTYLDVVMVQLSY